jgi:nucleotide-binding universal stress UspA family protein
MIRLNQILCPVDLSDTSGRALGHALRLARWYGAQLTVMQVIWADPPVTYPARVASRSATVLSPATRAELLEELRQFEGLHAITDVRIEAVLREGAIVTQILEEARAREAGLIVMGTHGIGGFARFLLGSVTERVLRQATCPVMTVGPSSTTSTAAGQTFATILCAVDFSPSSLNALRHAVSLA